jgi:hypothetical protein
LSKKSCANSPQVATVSLVNTFTIVAVENCLIPGLRNLFSDVTIGDVAEDTISEIMGDTPDVAKRRAQLSEEIQILDKALSVFRQYQRAGENLEEMLC